MNKENAHLFLPLVKALADGKTIQYYSDGRWVDDGGNIGFSNDPDLYRIKPEPHVRWALYTKNGEYTASYANKAAAEEARRSYHTYSYKIVKLVEEINA